MNSGIDTTVFVGMSLEAAKKLVKELYHNLEIRECTRDGRALPLIMNMADNRLNVETTSGVITKIRGYF